MVKGKPKMAGGARGRPRSNSRSLKHGREALLHEVQKAPEKLSPLKESKITDFYNVSRSPIGASWPRPFFYKQENGDNHVATGHHLLNLEKFELPNIVPVKEPKLDMSWTMRAASPDHQSKPVPTTPLQEARSPSALASQANGITPTTPSTALSRLSLLSPRDNISPCRTTKVPPPKCKARRRLQPDASANTKKLTEYFPVRRSERKCRSNIMKEKQTEIQESILSGREDGFMVTNLPDKGRGVIANTFFRKGEFTLEYHGELIDVTEAKRRETVYAQDQNKGCYMYYFTCRNKNYCIDATSETGRLGRLVNHSRQDSNLVTKAFIIDETPHLILVARRDIQAGEELLYDYGDRSKTSIMFHPWLAN